MGIFALLLLGCLAGGWLFRRQVIPELPKSEVSENKLSVIIPARNEAHNLPVLLESLLQQTVRPAEVIVVNDFSVDDTRRIAERYGVKVMDNPSLPPEWTGKNWALWNGYKQAVGDVFAFVDADIKLEPRALELLLRAREQAGGAVSVVPYHFTVKFYEKLALILNILGVFVFMSPFEKNNKRKGLYGPIILASRKDYERIGGHSAVKSEVLDDLNLGAKFQQAGVPVTNFLGRGLVSFRMYPNGIKSELQGFGKAAVLGTAALKLPTVLCTAAWVAGLLISETAPAMWHSPWFIPLLGGYLLYAAQIGYWTKDVGKFGKWMPLLHVLSALFFILVMLYSIYQVVFLGTVSWKDRHIRVGGRKTL